jgi:hypothetical protein
VVFDYWFDFFVKVNSKFYKLTLTKKGQTKILKPLLPTNFNVLLGKQVESWLYRLNQKLNGEVGSKYLAFECKSDSH